MSTFPENRRITDLKAQIAQLEADAEEWEKRVAEAISAITKIDGEFMAMLLADDREGVLRLFDARRYSATIVASDETIKNYFNAQRTRLNGEMMKLCT